MLAFALMYQLIGLFTPAHATPQRMTDKSSNVVRLAHGVGE